MGAVLDAVSSHRNIESCLSHRARPLEVVQVATGQLVAALLEQRIDSVKLGLRQSVFGRHGQAGESRPVAEPKKNAP